MQSLKDIATSCGKVAAPMTSTASRAIRFYPERWLSVARLGILAAATFGFTLTGEQIASTMALFEAIRFALGDSFATPNAKLTEHTVAGAKAGTPAPGVSVEALKDPFKGA